ncbi:MAG: hypothetical protein WBF48_06035 [Halarcobacter sp.]
MKKIMLTLILLTNLISNDKQEENIFIWEKEEASIENNFQENKYIYQTYDIGEAIGVTLLESLFNIDKIMEKKQLSTDFKYFDNSLKTR